MQLQSFLIRQGTMVNQPFNVLTIGGESVHNTGFAFPLGAHIALVFVRPTAGLWQPVRGTGVALLDCALHMFPARDHRLHPADTFDRDLVFVDGRANAAQAFEIFIRVEALFAIAAAGNN